MEVNTSGELVGATVGAWRVARLVSAGTMGAVYEVEHQTLRSRAAAKFLQKHLAQDDRARARFETEARALSMLSHPNIVTVFDVGALADGRPWFVMEYLEGGTLEEAVAREDFSLWRTAHVVTQIAAGLERAHARGVVHRDLKPANVMLMKLGGEDFVKVVDFGIAKLLEADAMQLTMQPTLLGTPDYMAPEQLRGEPVDARTDVYALGALTWELLVGRPPFWRRSLNSVVRAHLEERPASPTSQRREVPDAVSSVVLKALEKNPSERFASAMSFADALQEAVGRAASGRATPFPEPLPRPVHATRPAVLVVDGAQHAVQREHESSAGCFVLTNERVRPMTEVMLLTDEAGALRAQVVRTVSEAEAHQWRHPRGLFLEFIDTTARQRAALDGTSGRDEAVAEEFIDRLHARLWGDAYCALGLSPSASMQEVRDATTRLKRELDEWMARGLSEQRTRALRNARDRVKSCGALLGDVKRRALYDADRANWRGVAACVAEGLDAETASTLRTSWLTTHPNAEVRARTARDDSRRHIVARDMVRALAALEMALGADPLNLTLHELHRAMQMAAGLALA